MDFDKMRITTRQNESTKTKPKKKYSPATLTAYGSINDMTRGGTALGNEGQGDCEGSATEGKPSQCS
jgi:hypothetical protein